MSQSEDFKRAWLNKLAAGLARIAGETVCQQVMAGSKVLSGLSDGQDVIAWPPGAMARLDRPVDELQRQAMLLAWCPPWQWCETTPIIRAAAAPPER